MKESLEENVLGIDVTDTQNYKLKQENKIYDSFGLTCSFCLFSDKPFHSKKNGKTYPHTSLYFRRREDIYNFIDYQHNWWITSNELKHNKRNDKNILKLTGLHFDLDTENAGIVFFDWQDLVKYIFKVTGIHTTEVIDSGHGYYFNFFYKKAKINHSHKIINMWHHQHQHLENLINQYCKKNYHIGNNVVVDPKSKNASRLFRVPASDNVKNPDWIKPCYICYINPNYRYSFEYINQRINNKSQDIPKKLKKWLYVKKHRKYYQKLTERYKKMDEISRIRKINNGVSNYSSKGKKFHKWTKSKSVFKLELNHTGSRHFTGKIRRVQGFIHHIKNKNYQLFGSIEESLFIYFSLALALAPKNDAVRSLVKFGDEVVKPKIQSEHKPLANNDLKFMINHLSIEYEQFNHNRGTQSKFYYYSSDEIVKLMGFKCGKLYQTKKDKRKNKKYKKYNEIKKIKKLLNKKVSKSKISRDLKVSRYTVRKISKKLDVSSYSASHNKAKGW